MRMNCPHYYKRDEGGNESGSNSFWLDLKGVKTTRGKYLAVSGYRDQF